jgi:hypothetical protein
VKFAETLILDFLEEIVPEEFIDEGVFERFARSVRGGQSVDIVRVEQIGRKTCDCVLGGGWWTRGTVTGRCTRRRRGGRWVTNFGPLQSWRLGLWGGRPGVGLGHHRGSSGDGNKRRDVVVVEALVGMCFCGYTSSMEDDGLLDGLDPGDANRLCRPGRDSPFFKS